MSVVLPPSLLSNGFHSVRSRAPGLLGSLKPVAFCKLRLRLAQELAADAHVLLYPGIPAVQLRSHNVPRVLLMPYLSLIHLAL